MKWIIIILSIVLNTYGSSKEFFFFDHLKYRWLGATKFEVINSHYIGGESIKKPEGTWQVIGEVHVLNANFSLHKECIIYLLPLGSKPGTIKIKYAPLHLACQDLLYEEGNMVLDGIFNLGIEVSDGVQKKFHLKIKADSNIYEFYFPNYTDEKFITKKLQNSVKNSAVRGVSIGVPVNTVAKAEFSIKDGQVCFDVNDKCEVTLGYNCDECSNASYPVIASNCPSKFRQVCGQNKCGAKDEPACIRGWKSTKFNLDYCINDSPVGFCNQGLRVVCFDNILICK